MLVVKCTLGEHDLFDVELMLVKWVVAACHHLETVFQFVTIQMDEHSAVGDVVRWNVTEKSSVVEILEGSVPAWPGKVGESID